MKALLVDTNIAALPIYEALQTEFDITCVGNNPNDFMPRYGVKYEKVDYSNHKELQNYIDKNKYSVVIPGCNDVSYEICTRIKHSLLSKRIDHYESIYKIHNKEKFRKLASELELRTPRLFSDARHITYPLIVKPTDSFSGRGVTTIRTRHENGLRKAIAYARSQSRTSSHIVEEFIDGKLYSYSCFLNSQRVQEEFFVEEFSTANPFVVDLSRIAKSVPVEAQRKLKSAIEILAKHLNLRDGLIHTQFILKKEMPYIIEITRRCPGDLYSLLIQKATGFPYAKRYAATFLPNKQSFRRKKAMPFTVRYTMSESVGFSFRSIKIAPKMSINEIFVLEKSGQQLEPSPRGRVALAFFNPKTRSSQNQLVYSLKRSRKKPFTTK